MFAMESNVDLLVDYSDCRLPTHLSHNKSAGSEVFPSCDDYLIVVVRPAQKYLPRYKKLLTSTVTRNSVVP